MRFRNNSIYDLESEPLLHEAIYKEIEAYPYTLWFSPSLRYRKTKSSPVEIVDLKTNHIVFSKSYTGFHHGAITSMFWDTTESYFFFTKGYDYGDEEGLFVGKIGTDILLKLGELDTIPTLLFNK